MLSLIAEMLIPFSTLFGLTCLDLMKPRADVLTFFVGGLKVEIRKEFSIATPSNLANAMAKAQLYEYRNDDMLLRSRGSNQRADWDSKLVQNLLPLLQGASAVIGVGSPSINSNSNCTKTGNSLLVKRLSPIELRERRDKGLCFTCDEKYSFGHKCKN
uniref:Uncharacterized protein n=1 Tax=Cannabis sativa TaxID=3483 RepID=A0A803NWQ8_CANSA